MYISRFPYFSLTIWWLNKGVFIHLSFKWLMYTILLKWKQGYIFTHNLSNTPILTFTEYFQITRNECFKLSIKQADDVKHQVGFSDPYRKMPFPDALSFAMRWLDDLVDPEFLHLINKRGFGKRRFLLSTWRQNCSRSSTQQQELQVCTLNQYVFTLSGQPPERSLAHHTSGLY